MYFHNSFITRKSNQSLIIIGLIISFSSNSRQKARGNNAVPHTDLKTVHHVKYAFFTKSLQMILAKCLSSLNVKCINILAK